MNRHTEPLHVMHGKKNRRNVQSFHSENSNAILAHGVGSYLVTLQENRPVRFRDRYPGRKFLAR